MYVCVTPYVKMLVPPENFGLVECGVFRCTKLETDHFPFLETLKLRSIVTLDAEKPARTLKNFVEANKIDLYNLGALKISNHNHIESNNTASKNEYQKSLHETDSNNRNDPTEKDEIDVIQLHKSSKNDEWMLIERNIIINAFELLLDKTKHNILLIDSTSTLVGILRKIQKWNLSSILNEYQIYAGSSKNNSYYAENFLELIQVELIPYECSSLISNLDSKATSDSSLLNRNEKFDEETSDLTEEDSTDSELERKSSGSNRNSVVFGENEISKQENDDKENDNSDNASIDEEDLDDALLSGSPQIPANLLKFVEMKKQERPQEKTSKTSDDGNNSSTDLSSTLSSYPSSSDLRLFVRRRSSVEGRPRYSFKFPDGQGSSTSFSRLGSYNNKKATTRKNSLGNESGGAMSYHNRERYDYKFYKNLNRFPVIFENVDVIKLVLPQDDKLPDWFKNNRDYWESVYNSLNGQ